MTAATTATYEAELGRLVRQQTELINSGKTSGIEFAKLSAEIAAAEGAIAKLREASAGAGDAIEDTGNKASQAAGNFRSMAGAARDAGESTREAGDSADAAGDSFGNIARQSSAVEVSLGNLTEAYVRDALAAAGSAKSVRDYIRTLNGFFAAGADVENQIQARLDSLRKLNVVLSEEDQIRARLIEKYGNSSTLVEELVQEELRLAEAKKKTNDEAERGIEIEQRRAAQAGALGTSAAAPTSQFVGATGGRGSSTAAASSTSPINITINQNGATPENIRDLAPLIERELRQLGALRR